MQVNKVENTNENRDVFYFFFIIFKFRVSHLMFILTKGKISGTGLDTYLAYLTIILHQRSPIWGTRIDRSRPRIDV